MDQQKSTPKVDAEKLKLEQNLKKFLISGSASSFGGVCPIILKHIELEDRSDLVSDTLKKKELTKGGVNILGYNLRPYYTQYSSLEWENAIYLVVRFLQSSLPDINVNMVLNYAKDPNMCKESVIFVLAAMTLIKPNSASDKVRHDAYLVMQEVCTTTQEFFLFVQLRKLLAINCTGLASGHGFKKAVLRWYTRFEPKDLLLELIRSPSGFKWRHKDLLNLCHINPNGLQIGYQIVFHYIYTNASKTKARFEGMEEASEFLEIFSKMTFEDPNPIIDDYMKRAEFIKSEFGSSSYLDFPKQCYTNGQMWVYVLQNAPVRDILCALSNTNLVRGIIVDRNVFDYFFDTVRSKAFKLSQDNALLLIFALNRCRHGKLGFLNNEEKPANDAKDVKKRVPDFNPYLKALVEMLESLITMAMAPLKVSDQKIHIFYSSYVEHEYKTVPTMDSMTNQITIHQVYGYISQRMTTANTTIYRKKDNSNTPVPTKLAVSYIEPSTSDQRNTTPVDIATGIKYSMKNKASVCIFMCPSLSEDIVQEAVKTFQPQKETRVIVLGVKFNATFTNKLKVKTDSMLVINEFSSGTVPMMKAFANREF